MVICQSNCINSPSSLTQQHPYSLLHLQHYSSAYFSSILDVFPAHSLRHGRSQDQLCCSPQTMRFSWAMSYSSLVLAAPNCSVQSCTSPNLTSCCHSSLNPLLGRSSSSPFSQPSLPCQFQVLLLPPSSLLCILNAIQ